MLLSLLNRMAMDPDFVPAPEPESTKLNACWEDEHDECGDGFV